MKLKLWTDKDKISYYFEIRKWCIELFCSIDETNLELELF